MRNTKTVKHVSSLVAVKNLTRRSLPSERRVFSAIAKEVLPNWDVSLVFVSAKEARALNVQLRGKTYIPNVLSYALGPHSGEIIICLAEAERQAPAHSMSTRTFVLYLFIHGLLHVKGRAHGDIMEKCEQKLVARFLPAQAGATDSVRTSTHVTTHSHRH